MVLPDFSWVSLRGLNTKPSGQFGAGSKRHQVDPSAKAEGGKIFERSAATVRRYHRGRDLVMLAFGED